MAKQSRSHAPSLGPQAADMRLPRALLRLPGCRRCVLGLSLAGGGPVVRGGGVLVSGCLLVQRRHHRPLTRWVHDAFLEPRVATVQHPQGGGVTGVVVVGP